MPLDPASGTADRFSRQTRFGPLGPAGQQRIQNSSVLLVGVGALGSHSATTLTRAGIGRLWLVDRDIVELDNLQRQLLFDEADAASGRPKAIAAAARLGRLNSGCRIDALTEDFDASVFDGLDGTPDLILDGTDNFATRYLLNDLAIAHDIPWIYGGVLGAAGSAMAILPGLTPCLRCVLPSPAPTGETGTCETHGVLAPAVAAVAAFQCAQALKILAGRREDVARGVLELDVWQERHTLRLRGARPRAGCPTCGTREFPALHASSHAPVRLCGRNAAQITPRPGAAVNLQRLATQLEGVVQGVELTPHLLRFAAEGCRFSVFRGGRALVFGVTDPRRARILYDRYIGAV